MFFRVNKVQSFLNKLIAEAANRLPDGGFGIKLIFTPELYFPLLHGYINRNGIFKLLIGGMFKSIFNERDKYHGCNLLTAGIPGYGKLDIINVCRSYFLQCNVFFY